MLTKKNSKTIKIVDFGIAGNTVVDADKQAIGSLRYM